MEILNNPWFVGIGGGILSGLVVAYISRYIFSRRDSREYVQKTIQANNEVLYAIRPGISEGIIPSNATIIRLIEATARRYGVDESDMHDLNAVSSELTKEVMDSSFISAQTKQEYCEKLTQIKNELARVERVEIEKQYVLARRYRRQTTSVMAMSAGLLTGLAGAMVASTKSISFDRPDTLLLLMAPALVAIFASFASTVARELQKMKLSKLDLDFVGFKAEFKSKKSEGAGES